MADPFVRDIFISYVEEDKDVANAIADGLHKAGYSTWRYIEDILPGIPWPDQVAAVVESCKAVVFLISENSLRNGQQVTKEVRWVDSKNKPIVPLLHGIRHDEIEARQREWAMTLGTVVAQSIPPDGLNDRFTQRIVDALAFLGAVPAGAVKGDDVQAKLLRIKQLPNDPSAWAAAEEALEALTAEFPNEPSVHRAQGELFNRRYRFADAVAAYGRAVALEPRNSLLHWELGLALQNNGNRRDAAQSLQKALELGLDPTREGHARTLLVRLGGGHGAVTP